jgi:multidrug efflux system membrane fusion protein
MIMRRTFAFLAVMGSAACSKPAAPPKPPVSVTVATAAVADAPYVVQANGIVEPIQTVAVQAQVGGVLTSVHFKEGDEVKEGDVLMEIDPRPFQSALDQANAALARDAAQAANAQRDADRYSALVAKDYVTKSQADQAIANAVAQKSVVESDKAAIDNAKFNFENATVRAPISGKTGALQVKQGNLVKPGANPPLVVINQIHPILVRFTVPDKELPTVLKYAGGGNLKTWATPRGDASTEEGVLSFVDNGVDSTSGMVTLKAKFTNDRGQLWPGQFVSVRLELYTEQKALQVPNVAVQVGQDGPFVFVVKDGKAEMQNVTPGRLVGDNTTILKGLAAGAVVVTDGQSRLVPGAKVDIKTAAAPKAPAGGGQ